MAVNKTSADPDKSLDLVTVGEIAGAFGIKGWVKVKSFTQPQENILSYSPWWLKTKHGVRAIEIDESQQRSQGLAVHIVDLDDRDEAASLYGATIAIDCDQLPELAEDEYYWHQLIGLNVINHYEGLETRLGKVDSMLETGANDVLVIKGDDASIDDRERLIPYLPGSVVRSIDIEQGVIRVEWDPEF